MKAILWEKYGPPAALRIGELETPVAGPGQVLIEVRAAAVNPADWHTVRASPFFARATLGLLRPKYRVPGVDLAGKVTAVGSGVTDFQVGDAVYANTLDTGFGAFAQYAAVPATVVARKPEGLSFEEAAAIPMAAVTALQAFRRHGTLQPGMRVLVNGASGGVGTFAVQIAAAAGAEVIGVTSRRNLELVRSLGATDVVDYASTDFTAVGRYDRILDTVGNRRPADLRRALAEGGKCTVIGFGSTLHALSLALTGGKDIAIVSAHATAADLAALTAMADAGTLRPVIDRRCDFAEIPAAIAYVEKGHARGKVVIGGFA